MADQYFGWMADTKNESFATTLLAATSAYMKRFGAAPSAALIPVGMRKALTDVGTLHVEEWDQLRPGHVLLR